MVSHYCFNPGVTASSDHKQHSQGFLSWVNFLVSDFSVRGKHKQVQRVRGGLKGGVSEPTFWQWARQRLE